MGQAPTKEELIAARKLSVSRKTDGDYFSYEVMGYGTHGIVPVVVYNQWVTDTNDLGKIEQNLVLAQKSNNYVQEGPLPQPPTDRKRLFMVSAQNTLAEDVCFSHPEIFAAYKSEPTNFVYDEVGWLRKASPSELESLKDAQILTEVVNIYTQTINVYGFGHCGNVDIDFADRIMELEKIVADQVKTESHELCMLAAATRPIVDFQIIEWSEVSDVIEIEPMTNQQKMARMIQMMQANHDDDNHAPMNSVSQERFMQMMQFQTSDGVNYTGVRPTHDENGVEYPECSGCHKHHAPDN